jgi:hypothetical protein
MPDKNYGFILCGCRAYKADTTQKANQKQLLALLLYKPVY